MERDIFSALEWAFSDGSFASLLFRIFRRAFRSEVDVMVSHTMLLFGGILFLFMEECTNVRASFCLISRIDELDLDHESIVLAFPLKIVYENAKKLFF